MRITQQVLRSMGVGTADADRYIKPLNDVLPEFRIDTGNRVAHFLSQIAVESQQLSRVEENLNYSAKRLRQVFGKYFTAAQAEAAAHNPRMIGNRAYGKLPGQRNRLGNKTFEDGYNYRGRGLIQLTGRSNYSAFNEFLHNAGISDDVVADPDLVTTKYAVHSAVWFWDRRGVNALADQDDVVKVTKKVNGGDHGLAERKRLLGIAKKALGAIDMSPAISSGTAMPRTRLSGKASGELVETAVAEGWAEGPSSHWLELPQDDLRWADFWDAVYGAASRVTMSGKAPEPWIHAAFSSGLADGDINHWLDLSADHAGWSDFWTRFAAEVARPAQVDRTTEIAVGPIGKPPSGGFRLARLKMGSHGLAVSGWQRFLENQGIDPQGIDGIFGRRTTAATKAFQNRAGLEADGIVGPKTRKVALELGLVLVADSPAEIGHEGSRDYSVKVAVPTGINAGLSACKQSTVLDIFGTPGRFHPDPCQKVTSDKLKRALVVRDVGPFRVTGLAPAVDAVGRVFAQVRVDHPDLYSQLGTAGMLCVRAVRNSRKNFSNHSFGAAIDIKINGKLDDVKDGMSQVGLTILAPYFNAEGFYWGAGFGREDAMHFEASNQLVLEWRTQGLI